MSVSFFAAQPDINLQCFRQGKIFGISDKAVVDNAAISIDGSVHRYIYKTVATAAGAGCFTGVQILLSYSLLSFIEAVLTATFGKLQHISSIVNFVCISTLEEEKSV